MQKFRGAGGAGAVHTPPARPVTAAPSGAEPRDTASRFGAECRRQAHARGWVLALDVERRLREVRARAAASEPRGPSGE
ncbi:MAG TPA: hypothetical protein VFJ95_06205 [Gammaproteobacteria bacterium]|nr:hypothetical protein [Gammaproteobacteria bacterium]